MGEYVGSLVNSLMVDDWGASPFVSSSPYRYYSSPSPVRKIKIRKVISRNIPEITLDTNSKNIMYLEFRAKDKEIDPDCLCDAYNIVQYFKIKFDSFFSNITSGVSSWIVDDGTWQDSAPARNGIYYNSKHTVIHPKLKKLDIEMTDSPNTPFLDSNYNFKTYLVCAKGKDKGKVYAGVRWDWRWEDDVFEEEGYLKYYNVIPKGSLPKSIK